MEMTFFSGGIFGFIAHGIGEFAHGFIHKDGGIPVRHISGAIPEKGIHRAQYPRRRSVFKGDIAAVPRFFQCLNIVVVTFAQEITERFKRRGRIGFIHISAVFHLIVELSVFIAGDHKSGDRLVIRLSFHMFNGFTDILLCLCLIELAVKAGGRFAAMAADLLLTGTVDGGFGREFSCPGVVGGNVDGNDKISVGVAADV